MPAMKAKTAILGCGAWQLLSRANGRTERPQWGGLPTFTDPEANGYLAPKADFAPRPRQTSWRLADVAVCPLLAG
jgi:hypothetical protein